LREGRFVLIVECQTPPSAQPFESATAQMQAMARRAAEFPLLSGFAVTDRLRSERTHDPVQAASRILDVCSLPLMLHVSGKGSSEERVQELTARALSTGIRTLLFVTGDRSDLDQRDGHERHAYDRGYLDSVRMLELVSGHGRSLSAAAGVNPFKYNVCDQYLQYYKMLRKLAAGAEFMVTQLGWDMRKFQELQWYLQMRELHVPVLARLALLPTQEIRRIQEGYLPGVHFSRSFAALLQRESNVSHAQSLSAQLQRLALQVSGCSILGYSGVQIAGIPDAQTLGMVCRRVQQAMEQYTDYNTWLEAWQTFHGDLEFAPNAQPYYGFTRLLEEGLPQFDPDQSRVEDDPFPKAGWRDRLHALAVERLCRHPMHPTLQGLLERMLLPRDRSLTPRQLRGCAFLPPSDCPKRLVYGACGGALPDGTCEFGHQACAFQRVLAVAHAKRQLDILEEF
jgi:methylenetetrahydrofolate reductase (NADPH)